APESQRLDVVVRAVTRAAVKALAATREQLPALSAAGVVDAGGRGLVVVLDALHAVVCDGERVAPDAPAAGGGDPGEHRSRYEYEVMYLLADTDSERVGRLREDRKSTRLNSSHVKISYAVFCLKKKKIISSWLCTYSIYYNYKPISFSLYRMISC